MKWRVRQYLQYNQCVNDLGLRQEVSILATPHGVTFGYGRTNDLWPFTL